MPARSPASPDLAALVAPLQEPATRLARSGHRGWLVGEALSTRWLGRPASPWRAITSATSEELLELLPAAIPIASRDSRCVVMAPSPAGPIDWIPLARDAALEDVLACADFTSNAMAVDLADASLIDPFDGRRDLDAGRLRTPSEPARSLARAPIRGLRAARLAAQWGAEAVPELEDAMRAQRPPPDALRVVKARGELLRLFAAERAALGLGLLARTGWGSVLAPGASSDDPRIVELLPPDPVLRLAAWLRGGGADAFLARWRIPEPLAHRVRAVLARHPVERQVGTRSLRGVAQRLAAVDPATIERLFALRAAELQRSEERGDDHSDRERAMHEIDRLGEAIERTRAERTLRESRPPLALNGREAMAILGCKPGPEVGRALEALRSWVDEDPRRNHRERLTRYLERWSG